MLCLTFLLGAFPLKDADIFWHLRTGDLIRETGHVPRTDIYTFTRGPTATSEGVPWIDLHWLYQIGVSWLYERGGAVALTLAKCVITTLAMLILLTARRREWPVWVIVLAWLPALVALGGRMYVRPETLTLLYLAVFLAVVLRWERHPWLALILPLVQVLWVNSQGLFILGPIVLAFGLLDALLRGNLLSPQRSRWRRIILGASVATVLACVINPYGLRGALYPIELAGTMSNPVFSKSVAELTSIPDLIANAGLWNRLVQLHLLLIALGALSFLIPLTWLIVTRLPWRQPQRDKVAASPPVATGKKSDEKPRKRGRARKARKETVTPLPAAAPAPQREQPAGWRLSPFRLLLYAAFSLLSLQATRNSHQFAAVVGTVMAWNFGEWAAALRTRRDQTEAAAPAGSAWSPRLASLLAVSLVILWVASGQFYKFTGEGRTIGLGEEPLYYPHEAVKFAGQAGMPDRFVAFHNGHAALYEYYHGPQRKVYTDPRLEVAGPELFQQYVDLENRIKQHRAGWEEALEQMGRPAILADHEYNSEVGATLLTSDHWRCVWFDAIAAVFVHDSYSEVVKAHTVDFAARHFEAKSSDQARGAAELTALAKAYRKYVTAMTGAGGLNRPLVWLGLDVTRQLARTVPESVDAWKNSGLILFASERQQPPAARFRMPFEPVLDLTKMRATYCLRRAIELGPHEFLSLLTLKLCFDARQMPEAVLPLLDRFEELRPVNGVQVLGQSGIATARAEYLKRVGPAQTREWRNLSELDQAVSANLAAGRATSAAELLEQAYPPETAPLEVLKQMANLRMHLGEPVRARELWTRATKSPDPAIRDARIATTYLVEGEFAAARRHYRLALDAQPGLFEAHYCLAVLEQDAGDAVAAYAHARKAVSSAGDDAGRSAARLIASSVSRFARKTETVADRRAIAPEAAQPATSDQRFIATK
jgi:tetratricopeptide (TPR) repeat protein